MISYRDHYMPASDNGNGQKLSRHSDQPTVYGAMTVKNVRPSAFDNFYQGKQGRQAERLFHGQGKTRQVRMAELADPICKWAVRLADNGNTVSALQQQLAFLKYSDFLPAPTGGRLGM